MEKLNNSWTCTFITSFSFAEQSTWQFVNCFVNPQSGNVFWNTPDQIQVHYLLIWFSPFKFSLFICIGYLNQIPKYTCVDSFKYYPLYSWIVQIFVIVNQKIWNQILSKK